MVIWKRTYMYVVKVFFTVMSATYLWSCNTVTSNQLPPGTTVSVDPEEIKWTIPNNGGVCNFNPDYYQDQTISIMVLNDSGTYIPEAPLSITVDLAANTFTGIPVLALYNDVNENGVVDGSEELVTDTNSGAFDSSTDKDNGSKLVILRVNLSCSYKGMLYIISGGFMGTTSIIVEEGQAIN